MLTAHAGRPPEPHDIWVAWNADPLLLLGIALAAGAYARGFRRSARTDPAGKRRAACFVGALAASGLALISPLEAMSRSLASAHMVQHLMLTTVAAPLLALSAPAGALIRGTPAGLRRSVARWARPLRSAARPLDHPAAGGLPHVGALWFWHAAGPYGAALESPPLHALEHATLLLTAVLFWRLVVGPRGPGRVPAGAGVLLVFGMAVQSVLLSALLTFATTPWYRHYATTTAAWGLEPLADQQLAGVIMWVPAGAVHVAVALTLFVWWLRASERGDAPA